jgi:hypothetical protein
MMLPKSLPRSGEIMLAIAGSVCALAALGAWCKRAGSEHLEHQQPWPAPTP